MAAWNFPRGRRCRSSDWCHCCWEAPLPALEIAARGRIMKCKRSTTFGFKSRALNIALICAAIILGSCGGGSLQSTPPPRLLTGLFVQPAKADAAEPDGTATFSATATFNQPPIALSSYPVHWTSSDPSIATIDPTSGLATCLIQGGPITIDAFAGGLRASGSLTCSPISSTPVLTGYCAAPSYPRCSVKKDLIHCPVGQTPHGVLGGECGKYSAWSSCDSGLGPGVGKCLVQ